MIEFLKEITPLQWAGVYLGAAAITLVALPLFDLLDRKLDPNGTRFVDTGVYWVAPLFWPLFLPLLALMIPLGTLSLMLGSEQKEIRCSPEGEDMELPTSKRERSMAEIAKERRV